MKIFFLRIGALAVIGCVSGSVFPLLFSGPEASLALVFAFAVVLALSRGFIGGLPAVIALGLFADLAMLGRVGILSGFAVGLAYTASFFSRRFVIEHSALTTVSAGLLVGVSALLFPVFSDVLLLGPKTFFSGLSEVVSIGRMVFSVIAGAVFFLLATTLLRKYEEFMVRVDPCAALRIVR